MGKRQEQQVLALQNQLRLLDQKRAALVESGADAATIGPISLQMSVLKKRIDKLSD